MSAESATKENGSNATDQQAAVTVDAEPTSTKGKQQSTAIQLHEPTMMMQNRPIMPSEIEVAETITVAGVRPIAASHLSLVGSFLNGRPISSSAIQVKEMLPGDRPVFASEFHMVEGAMLPGDRPIACSSPALMHASTLPGNRPIASNEVDDSETLMGFID